MRRNYFSIIKVAGWLLIGGVLIVSVAFQTVLTFILGCAAWALVCTSMIYDQIKIRKNISSMKFMNLSIESPDTPVGFATNLIAERPPNHRTSSVTGPVSQFQKEDLENSFS